MPVVYAVVLLAAAGVAVIAFFIAGRAVHAPHETTDDTDDTDG
ncbi:MAG TPA: hypothetical protein VFY79_02655 [Dehalococcoidia bacterium]|nr:hypothetical protein [Dehalococcoidia bacterium]